MELYRSGAFNQKVTILLWTAIYEIGRSRPYKIHMTKCNHSGRKPVLVRLRVTAPLGRGFDPGETKYGHSEGN
jgi:hypothetical protein